MFQANQTNAKKQTVLIIDGAWRVGACDAAVLVFIFNMVELPCRGNGTFFLKKRLPAFGFGFFEKNVFKYFSWPQIPSKRRVCGCSMTFHRAQVARPRQGTRLANRYWPAVVILSWRSA
jgi:hypothetical protein